MTRRTAVRAVILAAAVLVVVAYCTTAAIKRESFIDLHSGRVRSRVRLWRWTFSEQESTSRFTDWATSVGFAFDTPRWEPRSSKGLLDHSGGQMFGGRVGAFLDELALAAQSAKLDKSQAPSAIASGMRLIEQSGPGNLVGDVTEHDGIVIITGPDKAPVWQSKWSFARPRHTGPTPAVEGGPIMPPSLGQSTHNLTESAAPTQPVSTGLPRSRLEAHEPPRDHRQTSPHPPRNAPGIPFTMRGTKTLCITLGVLLILLTILPAPFGLLIQTEISGGLRTKLHGLLQDGSITINTPALAANHGREQGGYTAADDPPDSEGATGNLLVLSAYREVTSSVWTVTFGQFFMGVLWLGVGIRIPSKLPSSVDQNLRAA